MTNRDSWLLCGALVGLGCVGLAFGDFARQWQPVPPDIPGRTVLAYGAAIMLIGLSLASVVPRSARPGLIGLAGFLALWTLCLHGPVVAAKPEAVVGWLGLAEIGCLAFGAVALLSRLENARRLATVVRVGFGLCALVFGLSHFVYAEFTAMLVPSWMPAKLFWAYATGAGHVAAGLALTSGVLARLAATVLAVMCASFALLVHVPRVAAAPTDHAEWLGVFLALAIAGAAWAIRSVLGPPRVAEPTD